jgi:hypothetical protein
LESEENPEETLPTISSIEKPDGKSLASVFIIPEHQRIYDLFDLTLSTNGYQYAIDG